MKKKKKNVIKVEPIQEQRQPMDLPPVMQQRHVDHEMMAADMDILKASTQQILKKEKHYDPYADFDPQNDPFKQKESEQLSMHELMKKKLDKIEDTNKESVEDRKARLKAQRDMIVKKKVILAQTYSK